MTLELSLPSSALTLPFGGDVLLLQQSDRWFLGDFLRHVSRVSSFEHRPDLSVDLATHGAYLPLVDAERFRERIDVAQLNHETFRRYDLVVLPTSQAPKTFDSRIRQGLYTWDTGWLRTRRGRVIEHYDSTSLNYFRSARQPVRGLDQTPPHTFQLRIRDEEHLRANRALAPLFRGRSVIVYNPTASNPFTRESTAAKEVENRLELDLHVRILRELLEQQPADVLIGSAIKPGDVVNQRAITELRSALASRRVRDIYECSDDWLRSLRGFATLLADPSVIACLGGGTGTNTHLAAFVGLPSLSVEHEADSIMKENWTDSTAFQMGSFRWRNPSMDVMVNAGPLTAFDGDHRARNIASSFSHHLLAVRGEWSGLLAVPFPVFRSRALLAQHQLRHAPRRAVQTFAEAGAMLKDDARDFYLNFGDELAYLASRHSGGCDAAPTSLTELAQSAMLVESDGGLVRDLLLDSNLEKLLRRAGSQ